MELTLHDVLLIVLIILIDIIFVLAVLDVRCQKDSIQEGLEKESIKNYEENSSNSELLV